MKPTYTLEDLDKDQADALLIFATDNGRYWKQALREAWMTGNYSGFAGSGFLQQIRNNYGPEWLVKFRFTRDSHVDGN